MSETEAKEVVGITLEGNKSTASRFKYGRTYFVPSLKIHKLKPEELLPGAEVPIRLITCLQDRGVYSSSFAEKMPDPPSKNVPAIIINKQKAPCSNVP